MRIISILLLIVLPGAYTQDSTIQNRECKDATDTNSAPSYKNCDENDINCKEFYFDAENLEDLEREVSAYVESQLVGNKKCPQYTFGFPNRRQIQDYVIVNASIPDMTEATVCAWVSPSHDKIVNGAVFSYATTDHHNTLLIEFEPKLRVYLYPNKLTFDGIENKNENHICVVVSTINNSVHLYLNGTKHSRKTLRHKITKIKGQGTVVLGQDQDKILGKFEVRDSFLGSIKNCMLWNRTLTPGEIEDMQDECNCPKDYIMSAKNGDRIFGNVTSEFFDTC
ncbi:neuronal pentraxin-1-like [Styela clava]